MTISYFDRFLILLQAKKKLKLSHNQYVEETFYYSSGIKAMVERWLKDYHLYHDLDSLLKNLTRFSMILEQMKQIVFFTRDVQLSMTE